MQSTSMAGGNSAHRAVVPNVWTLADRRCFPGGGGCRNRRELATISRRQQVQQPVERHGGDVPIRSRSASCSRSWIADTALSVTTISAALAEKQADAVPLQPGLQLCAVKTAQRHRRQGHFEAAPVRQETVHKDLASVAQTDAVRRFVERTGQHHGPQKRSTKARRLPVPLQPAINRFVGCSRFGYLQPCQTPRDPRLFPTASNSALAENSVAKCSGAGSRSVPKRLTRRSGVSKEKRRLRSQKVRQRRRSGKKWAEIGAATHADVFAVRPPTVRLRRRCRRNRARPR